MTVMWVARQLRADQIGPVSLLTRKICDATVEDIVGIYKIIDFLKKTKEMSIKISGIPVQQTIAAVFADASPTPLKRGKKEAKAHGGFLVCLAHQDLMRHKTVPVNMMVWRSGKIERECASSLSGETYTMVSGCAACEWVVALPSTMR